MSTKQDDNITKITKIIESYLRDHIVGIDIISVNIEPDYDEYNERILLVTIIFNSKEELIDPSKTSKMLRHILPKIHNTGEIGFPVISFISESDIRD